ncbi:MAG: dihydrofolate reductase [Spirochaetes bacterium]|nr:dihydrofolate reductase [Spirochaetota bacterium]
MIVSIIAAMSKNRVIGNNGKIPWHIQEDMRFFKRKTRGHTVIMGRKTYESIGKPLSDRINIVLSKNSEFRAPGAIVIPSLEAALERTAVNEDEVFIIGGEKVYEEALKKADRIYISLVEEDFTGDTFFPEITGPFEEISRKSYDTKPPFTRIVLKRGGT